MFNPKGKFINAYFANNEQTMVHAYWTDPDNERAIQYTCNITDTSSEVTQAVLKEFTVDDIRQRTDENNKAIIRARHEFLMTQAKNEGLVYNPGNYEPNRVLNFDWLIDLPEGVQGQDFLFELKLRLFDIPAIAEDGDSYQKKMVRDAPTPLKAIYEAGKILYK